MLKQIREQQVKPINDLLDSLHVIDILKSDKQEFKYLIDGGLILTVREEKGFKNRIKFSIIKDSAVIEEIMFDFFPHDKFKFDFDLMVSHNYLKTKDNKVSMVSYICKYNDNKRVKNFNIKSKQTITFNSKSDIDRFSLSDILYIIRKYGEKQTLNDFEPITFVSLKKHEYQKVKK